MRRIKARRQVGMRVGSSNAKSDEIQIPAENNATKNLNRVQRLLVLTKGSDIDNRSTRLRQSVDFRGIKICFRIQINNVAGLGGQKFAFNWAIVSPKQLDANITALPTEEFFRGSGETSRAQDFAGTLTGLDLHCLPINRDKYVIHRHKRMVLGPYESTEGKSERYFETYVPVKRKVVYNQNTELGTEDNPEGRDMWMIWWGAFLNEGTGNGQGSAFTTQFKAVRYFREPKV